MTFTVACSQNTSTYGGRGPNTQIAALHPRNVARTSSGLDSAPSTTCTDSGTNDTEPARLASTRTLNPAASKLAISALPVAPLPPKIAMHPSRVGVDVIALFPALNPPPTTVRRWRRSFRPTRDAGCERPDRHLRNASARCRRLAYRTTPRPLRR